MAKSFSPLSYFALFIGLICFFITFVEPARIVMVGSLVGDYVGFGLTIVGVVISIIGLVKKAERKILSFIALILSLSFPIFIVIWFVLTVLGVCDFAP